MIRFSCLVLAASALTACAGADGSAEDFALEVENEDSITLSWEEFLETATAEEGPDGTHYIVEGDIPVGSLEALEEYYYERYLINKEKLAVAVFNGADDKWPNGDQRNLEYCVSTSFPATGVWSRSNVLAAMTTATSRWKQAANVNFVHVSSRDSNCLSGSAIPHSRFFKVAPQPLSLGVIACAFFPVSRGTCPQLDGSTVGIDLAKTPPLSTTRTVTHELGHVLGLWHEYMRADGPSGAGCAQPASQSRNLTAYDNTSIMQSSSGLCGGGPTENLSQLDRNGIVSLYGIPPSWHMPLFYSNL